MVVSFDIYTVLNIVQLIVVLVYAFFSFVEMKKTFIKKVILLITSSILLIINVFQLPMQIQLDESYGFTIILIIVCFINALMFTFDLGKLYKDS